MTTPAVVAADTAAPVVVDPAAPVVAPVVTAPVQVALNEPVTPPVVAPVAAPVVEPVAGEAITYEATGDAGLDVALAFVGKLGIGMDHPAMIATETGDFSLIKAHLATMGDKSQGWEQMVALAEQAHTRTEADSKAKADKVSAAVIGIAGTKENWDAINKWASANADAAEKTEINAMFAAGPVQARAAAIMLKGLYEQASGTTVNPASATQNPSPGNAASSNTALSPREYSQAVRELSSKIGAAALETSPAYAALGARRNAYRG